MNDEKFEWLNSKEFWKHKAKLVFSREITGLFVISPLQSKMDPLLTEPHQLSQCKRLIHIYVNSKPDKV